MANRPRGDWPEVDRAGAPALFEMQGHTSPHDGVTAIDTTQRRHATCNRQLFIAVVIAKRFKANGYRGQYVGFRANTIDNAINDAT